MIRTVNSKIFELFGQELINSTPRYFPLCPQCFDKLKDLLEEIESDGWIELDENEFPDLDEEIEKYPENGLGT